MTKPYEIEITETRTVVTRVMVQADSWNEAQTKALKGDTIAVGEPQMQGDPERVATGHAAIRQGSTLRRIATVLQKPDAFTIHARLWTSAGLAPSREYAVVKVGEQDRRMGITLQEFPEGRRIFVPENEIFDIRIESESDEIAYAVTNIRYDTDGSVSILDLPDELEIDLPADTEEGDVEELIADAISDRTGWCHKGFDFELAA